MSSLGKIAIAAAAALVLSGQGSSGAQPAPPADQGAQEALVKELRLLRLAVERQSTLTARAQLVVARGSIQYMRASYDRSHFESLEAQLDGVERERDQAEAMVRETQRALEQAPEPQRAQAETLSQRAGEQYAQVQQRAAALDSRLARARESMDVENARYAEIERLMSELDRQLQAAR